MFNHSFFSTHLLTSAGSARKGPAFRLAEDEVRLPVIAGLLADTRISD